MLTAPGHCLNCGHHEEAHGHSTDPAAPRLCDMEVVGSHGMEDCDCAGLHLCAACRSVTPSSDLHICGREPGSAAYEIAKEIGAKVYPKLDRKKRRAVRQLFLYGLLRPDAMHHAIWGRNEKVFPEDSQSRHVDEYVAKIAQLIVEEKRADDFDDRMGIRQRIKREYQALGVLVYTTRNLDS